MSITVSNLPQNYRTVYNPIEIVVKESDATTRGYEGFQYIIDIYETTGVVLLSRLKTPIRTDGFGRVNMNGVMESYVQTILSEINQTNQEAMFDNSDGPQYYNDASWRQFKIRFGWEHYNGGTLTQSLNQTVSFPSPLEDNNFYDLIVFNGALPNYRGNVLNFYDWQVTDKFKDYVVGSGATRSDWLTNQPNTLTANESGNVKVELTDEGYLYFLYDNAAYPIDRVKIEEYDSTGAVLSTSELRKPTAVTEHHVSVAASPQTLNNVAAAEFLSGSQPIISSSATSYSVALYNTTVIKTKKMFFNIDSECRYETRRLEFLNSLGGFDYFNFTKVSKRSEEIERKFFKQNPENLSSVGVINYSISDRQKVQYYTASKPKMKLTSDWIDADKFNWLLELIESPEIYLHENNQRIPVKNIEGNWEEKRSKVDKLFNLEVNLEFGVDNYRQRY
jgi:hypothetical protein